MSPRDYRPAKLRYLKARLWNLARPGFWGTAIFLAVLGLVIREYWTNPQFLSSLRTNQNTSNKPVDNLSQEDRAFIADIDNLPVLYSELNKNTLPPVPNLPDKKDKTDNNKTLLDRFLENKNDTASKTKSSDDVAKVNSPSTSNLENPFLNAANKLLDFRNLENNSNSAPTNSLAPTPTQTDGNNSGLRLNQTNSTPSISSVNALQSALEQSSINSSQSINNSSTQNNSASQQPLNSILNNNLNSVPNVNSRNQISETNQTQSLNGFNSSLNFSNNFSQPQNLYGNYGNQINNYNQPGVNNQPQNLYGNYGNQINNYNQPGVNSQPQNLYGNTNYNQPAQSQVLPIPNSYSAPTTPPAFGDNQSLASPYSGVPQTNFQQQSNSNPDGVERKYPTAEEIDRYFYQ